MPIIVKCRCGKRMKARDSSAGKRVKCPDCGSPVSVPAMVKAVEEIDEYDDYGDDPYNSPPPRRSAPAKKKKPVKKSGGGSGAVIAGAVIGGAVLGILVVGGALWFLLGKSDSSTPPANADAAATSESADVAATASDSSLTDSAIASGGHSADSVPANAVAATDAETSTPSSTGNNSAAATVPPATSATATASSSADNLWVVLSDFRDKGNENPGNRTLTVNYRIASGQPTPGREYVLYVGASMGSIMERYLEIPLDLQSNGSVVVPVGIGMTGELRAYVGWKKSRREWEPVSGEINPNGPATSGRRPPTVAEAAGADAVGKSIALANARFENSRLGGQAFVVDYVLQGEIDRSKRYFLVIKGQGDPVQTDVTFTLMRAQRGEKSQFGVRTIGPGGFPSGTLQAHVETRMGIIDRSGGQVVSNTVSTSR